jgi:hypothetical protein
MPFIDTIVKYINESLKAGSLKSIQPVQFVGITTVLPRMAGERLELIPATCNNDGEYVAIVPDDRFAVQLYHKVVSHAYTNARQQSFGDDYAFKATSELILVVIADSRKIKMQAEALEPVVVYGLPGSGSAALTQATGMGRISISPISSNLDKIMVFRQEYPSSEYFLKPFQQLFSIRYRVEAAFDKNCINKCLCSSQS